MCDGLQWAEWACRREDTLIRIWLTWRSASDKWPKLASGGSHDSGAINGVGDPCGVGRTLGEPSGFVGGGHSPISLVSAGLPPTERGRKHVLASGQGRLARARDRDAPSRPRARLHAALWAWLLGSEPSWSVMRVFGAVLGVLVRLWSPLSPRAGCLVPLCCASAKSAPGPPPVRDSPEIRIVPSSAPQAIPQAVAVVLRNLANLMDFPAPAPHG